ncbi:olfactory receptor 1L6-like [Bombina bombina]|uniref:olfactory receptor 1L6-like n=1 Tax=Bombina bombina TaxID=8345 RepID=UPI00235B16DE|nr:olfactory receptor 1L6-like [Bombina bombina]
METINHTYATFTLLGLSEKPSLRLPLFSFLLIAYCLCLIGNSFMTVLIIAKSQLHTPMYFLLGNLSIIDVCLMSITIPRVLSGLLSKNNSITFHGCFLQLFFFLAVGNMDSFLLAIMSMDRYAAICQPLRYSNIMSKRTCILLVISSWVIVCLHSLLYTVMFSFLVYCDSVVHHFFCDGPALLMISCTDTSVVEMFMFVEGSIIVMSPMFFILASYTLIIRAVLRLRTSSGRKKTFSTCSSHLTLVIIFYSSIIFMYFRPSSLYSPVYDRVVSVLYTVLIPMLNPFIYSLRNKEVKNAVKKFIRCGGGGNDQ